jgi:hypothetical protein
MPDEQSDRQRATDANTELTTASLAEAQAQHCGSACAGLRVENLSSPLHGIRRDAPADPSKVPQLVWLVWPMRSMFA